LSDCKKQQNAFSAGVRRILALAAGKFFGKKILTHDMANTKSITDKTERKKVKRTARKKAAPKAKRTTPRGSNKAKIKKLSRGQSKR
jgi:hypothetical protein